MRRLKRSGYLLGLIMMALLVGCNAENVDSETEEEQSVPVQVEEVQRGELNGTEVMTGRTESNTDVFVTPKGQGEVLSFHVSEGDTVQKGDLIASLDNTDARIAVRQAEAGLSQAVSNLEQARTQRDSSISTSNSALEQAKVSWDDAKTQLERMEKLYAEGAVSQNEYEQAVQAETQARLSYEQAQVQAESASGDENLQVSEAAVASARASLEQAQQQLEHMEIKAPVSGEVVSIPVNVGQIVSAQTSVARIVDLNVLTVQTSITSDKLNVFQEGDIVDVFVDSLQEMVTGEVAYISQAADDTGKFALEVTIDNEAGHLRAGMIAQIEFSNSKVEDAILVPTESVVEESQETFIYVMEGEIATQVPVEILMQQSETTAVAGELNEGDQVIVRGQFLINDGDPVRVIEGGQ